MTDRKAEFLALLERYALTVARREGAVDYAELRATEALADELRTELVKFIGDGWIPVSERLPEKDGYYLVSDDHGDIMSCEFLADYKGEPIWDVAGVLYWMPLPEPPEVV